jgi:hypothetical protein
MRHATLRQRPRLRALDLPLLVWRCVRFRSDWFVPERLT